MNGKRVLLGVTGSIAAYKIPLLTRALVKEGAEVKVLMTRAAQDFVTPATLSTLSKNEVISDFYQDSTSGVWNNHVELGLWADIFLIAPASANTLAKMANGHCDNMLLATYLSAKCPVWVAPAMDADMYNHPAVKENIQKLTTMVDRVFPADSGELASGLIGEGRMPEPETLFQAIKDFFLPESSLKGKTITITAGPTYEKIDPVRFIGNFSSGKMGVSLAKAFLLKGADVNLILGPSSIGEISEGINLIRVESADEMFSEVKKLISNTDIFVGAAAVADYKPKNQASQKIKKDSNELVLELEKNPDILSYVGQNKKNGQKVLGFALETENEIENAKGKLSNKNLDWIVLNSLNDIGAAFQHDTNKVSLIDKNNKVLPLELDTKDNIAVKIVDFIAKSV